LIAMASILYGKQTDLPNERVRLEEFFENLLLGDESLRDKTAVVDPKKSLTFGQLNSSANQVARALICELGVGATQDEGHVLVAVRFEPGKSQLKFGLID